MNAQLGRERREPVKLRQAPMVVDDGPRTTA
jgi:hypothetical protein